jgi:hypothetical protein
MPELEDLTGRTFDLSFDVSQWNECFIREQGWRVGTLTLTDFRSRKYTASLAGLNWQLSSRVNWSVIHDSISFVGDSRAIAEGTVSHLSYEAMIDRTDRYKLSTSKTTGSAYWIDPGGEVVMTYSRPCRSALPKPWIRTGIAEIFAVCPVTHAPILLLLGLRHLVFGKAPSLIDVIDMMAGGMANAFDMRPK